MTLHKIEGLCKVLLVYFSGIYLKIQIFTSLTKPFFFGKIPRHLTWQESQINQGRQSRVLLISTLDSSALFAPAQIWSGASEHAGI